MKVRNINGADASDPHCGTWLQHWLRYSRQPLPRFCVEAECPRHPTTGALVQKEDAGDDGWYVVPLCEVHSALKGQSLMLARHATLVTADVQKTCDRPRKSKSSKH